MDKFWEYLKESIIVQSLLTLMFSSVLCYLWVTGQEVPDALLATSTAVLGFWFRVKSQHDAGRLVDEIRKGNTSTEGMIGA